LNVNVVLCFQEKKLSSGSLGGCDGARPKVVTVKHPESNKPKPTVKKNKPIQADLDVAKEFIRCKEEGNSFMFCSSLFSKRKSNVAD
jgi:hypothetical protein